MRIKTMIMMRIKLKLVPLAIIKRILILFIRPHHNASNGFSSLHQSKRNRWPYQDYHVRIDIP